MKSIRFLLLLFILTGSQACHICKKKSPSGSTHEGLNTQVPPPAMVAYYRKYQTAMGKGRGIQFTITLPKNTFDSQSKLDSLNIGGKWIPAQIRQMDPCIVEGNYLVNDPEPTVEVPTPKKVHDSLLDDLLFEPALISFTQNGIQKSFRVNQFIEKRK